MNQLSSLLLEVGIDILRGHANEVEIEFVLR